MFRRPGVRRRGRRDDHRERYLIGLPVACASLVVLLHVGWIRPWEGRYSLRSAVDLVVADIDADEVLGNLSSKSRQVQFLHRIAALVAESPLQWRTRLAEEGPFIDGVMTELSGTEAARLKRYAGQLETALRQYGRCVRPTGARPAVNVSAVLFDPLSYWQEIDLTGCGDDPVAGRTSVPDSVGHQADPGRHGYVVPRQESGSRFDDILVTSFEARSAISSISGFAEPVGPTFGQERRF